MRHHELTFGGRIHQALDARARAGIPDDIDLWSRVEQASAVGAWTGTGYSAWLGSSRRAILVAAVCLALLTSGVAAAVAASPSLRHLLEEAGIPAGHAGEGIDRQGRPYVIQPLPPFRLFYPAWQPDGLAIRGVGQFNPRYGGSGWGGGYDCPRPPRACPPAVSVFSTYGAPTLLVPFDRTSTDVVWFGSYGVPPDRRRIQIVEWNRKTSTVKSLTAAQIPRVYPKEAETLLTMDRGGTTIAIETNLGARVAKRVADSLRPLRLSAH